MMMLYDVMGVCQTLMGVVSFCGHILSFVGVIFYVKDNFRYALVHIIIIVIDSMYCDMRQ